MAFSTDADLVKLIPDILLLGITSFTDDHVKAQAEIERELRIKWWPKKRLSFTDSHSYLEMEADKLVDAQFTEASAYLVLSRHALPKLSNWVDNDRFLSMIDFYHSRYTEEMEAIFGDGVQYDTDGDGTITDYEKQSQHVNRLDR